MVKNAKQYTIYLPTNITPIISFNHSQIYRFNQNNLHMAELTNIMEDVIDNTNFSHSLCLCYDALIKNNMGEIISKIIDNCNIDADGHEMVAICLAAIINEDINIINMLSEKKFNFDIKFNTYINTCLTYVNLIDYAIYHNKNTVAQYLLELGTNLVIDLTNQSNKLSFALSNLLDDKLFDFILDSYPQYHQSLFIASICCPNIRRMDKLLTSSSTNIDIELPTNNLHEYYNVARNIYKNLNLDIFKLLTKYGLNVTQELLEKIFVNCDIILVDYIMSEYHFVPNNKLIDNVLSSLDMEKIKLFAKHNIDLSGIKIINSQIDLVSSLEKCNLDPKVFLTYILDYIDEHEV